MISRRRRWWLGVALFLLAVFLALPSLAVASAVSAPTQVFPVDQVWALVVGGMVPLVTYALNYVGPWVSEPIKAAVLVVVSAAATALYTALATNVIGFNVATLQLVLTGVASSLAAHHALWKPSGVAAALGAGQNRRLKAAGGTVKPTPAPPPPVGAVSTEPDAAKFDGPEQPHLDPPPPPPAAPPPPPAPTA